MIVAVRQAEVVVNNIYINTMFLELKNRCEVLSKNFVEIPQNRKDVLDKITTYIQQKLDAKQQVNLNFICTHNSRRSHLGQVWAAVAANYYQVPNIYIFSGGTEATRLNANAINALKGAGFIIKQTTESSNPIYHVYIDQEIYITCFSKTYDDASSPKKHFAAVMTCSDAEQNCPLITGCDLRIGVTYNDPKAYDNTVLQDEKYTERSNQIALECLYVFSKVL
jgi:protein-tyrosine phosphatase/arsenate reductase